MAAKSHKTKGDLRDQANAAGRSVAVRPGLRKVASGRRHKNAVGLHLKEKALRSHLNLRQLMHQPL